MPRARNLTSYTEMTSLARCEMQWHYRYMKHRKVAKGWKLVLGLVTHALVAAWEVLPMEQRAHITIGETEDLLGATLTTVFDAVEAEDGVRPALTDEQFNLIEWLFGRYIAYYTMEEGDETDAIQPVAHETRMRAKIAGTSQYHECITDGLWKVAGHPTEWKNGLWVVERKTYGRNTKVELTAVDPQLTLNLWVARVVTGLPIKGVVWDGIYNYRWVKPRPLGDSFTRLWLPRSDQQTAAALRDVRAGLRRRTQLRNGATPRRNIGDHCLYMCDHRDLCWAGLGVEPEVIEFVED